MRFKAASASAPALQTWVFVPVTQGLPTRDPPHGPSTCPAAGGAFEMPTHPNSALAAAPPTLPAMPLAWCPPPLSGSARAQAHPDRQLVLGSTAQRAPRARASSCPVLVPPPTQAGGLKGSLGQPHGIPEVPARVSSLSPQNGGASASLPGLADEGMGAPRGRGRFGQGQQGRGQACHAEPRLRPGRGALRPGCLRRALCFAALAMGTGSRALSSVFLLLLIQHGFGEEGAWMGG